MSQAPAMPLFCDAYLADTMHLSNEESGCYLKLLMVTWRNNGMPLVDDDMRLARVLGISINKWRDRIRPVLVGFFNVSEGTWRQKRLEKEWNFVRELSEQNSRAGKASAAARALKLQETHSTGVEHSFQRNANETSTPIPIPTKNEGSKDPSISRSSSDFDEWYKAFPRKKDPGRAAKAYRAARKHASAAELLAGALRYRTECEGTDPEFTKHPTTWLNGQSWKNEPDLPRPINGHTRHAGAPDPRFADYHALSKPEPPRGPPPPLPERRNDGV